MEKNEHVRNQVIYVTNSVYDELRPSAEVTVGNSQLEDTLVENEGPEL